jgi:hypothetical protein
MAWRRGNGRYGMVGNMNEGSNPAGELVGPVGMVQ